MLTEEKVMETKRIVKKAMKGYMPNEKTRAWRGVHNYMQIADLQQELAIKGEHIELGEGNYAADIVIVTDQKLGKAEMEVLRNILRAIDIPETEVYRTQAFDEMWEITEIQILNPIIVIYFGGHNCKLENPPMFSERTKPLFTHPLSAMLPDSPDQQTAKMEAWESLKEIMKYYDEVIEREKG